jgi:ketosteroid isomerase-like protein
MSHLLLRSFQLAGLLLATPLLAAHEPVKPAASQSSPAETSADARAAVEVVDAFSAALKSGDIVRATTYLHPDVLVLESGGAERSRAEYLTEHAGADAEFLRDATIVPLARRVDAAGELAWVASESRIEYPYEGATKRVLSTETMVLRRDAEGWKIVHIHWSSRSVPDPATTP